ncbi:MAG: SIP domain-containing protein [Cryobacterium sp.]|nr:SIP domain-containing protein [Cryobacterium sp.]
MTDGAHYLLVGDGTDLDTLRATVKKLPPDAYGQIYIEVTSEREVQEWSVPKRMSLNWLRRDSASSAVGTIAPRGELIARAVGAWVAEWVPEEHREHRLPYALWLGCSASEWASRLHYELAQRIDHIHVHRPNIA